jgi:hypothetical protein
VAGRTRAGRIGIAVGMTETVGVVQLLGTLGDIADTARRWPVRISARRPLIPALVSTACAAGTRRTRSLRMPPWGGSDAMTAVVAVACTMLRRSWRGASSAQSVHCRPW